MPRDTGGIYDLPSGNPVIPGTVIESDWANPTMTDLKNEMSDSLSRSGKGGMLAALRGLDGSAALPTFSFTNEPSTGRFRAGPGQVVEAVAGVPVVRYLSSGLEQWDSDTMAWVPLTPRDALGTPFDPAQSNLTSTNVQDAIQEVNDKTGGVITADSVSYDYLRVPVYFVAPTVQLAIDRIGADIPGLANDILDNADAIDIIGGDLIRVTDRVTQVEITANTNTTNIALHDTRITANTTDINTERGRIDTNTLDIATNVSNIAQNAEDILFVYNITQTNAADITTNFQNIATNTTNISSNLSKINTNTGNISNNTGNISSNLGKINTNTGNINAILGAFPGGVLQVASGGTSTTTSVGTQHNVLSHQPTLTDAYLADGQLDTNVLAVTQGTSNDSTRIATTAFVHNVVDSLPGGNDQINARFITSGSSSGEWYAIRDAELSTRWVIIQYGSTSVSASGTNINLPYSAGGTGYEITLAPVNNQNGITTRVVSQSSTYFTVACSPASVCNWHVLGQQVANFAAYVETGDRYYNKVTRSEHVQQLSGPWDANPDVVILPPGNTFWGPQLDPYEELTYDIDDLPNGRALRVVPLEDSLVALLWAAGVTSAAMSRAIYLDGRGIPGPLNAIDSAIDAIVLSEGETLETLVGLL